MVKTLSSNAGGIDSTSGGGAESTCLMAKKKKIYIYIYISRSDNLINPMKTFKKSFLKKIPYYKKKNFNGVVLTSLCSLRNAALDYFHSLSNSEEISI